jgi:proteic killer suppression protein
LTLLDPSGRRVAAGRKVRAFAAFERAARLKLDRLASALTDLSALPGNRFEALRGDRKEQYSICINDQWRICFTWDKRKPGPSDVEIVGEH